MTRDRWKYGLPLPVASAYSNLQERNTSKWTRLHKNVIADYALATHLFLTSRVQNLSHNRKGSYSFLFLQEVFFFADYLRILSIRQVTYEGFGRKQSWLNRGYILGFKETTKNLCQNGWYPHRVSNLVLHDCNSILLD